MHASVLGGLPAQPVRERVLWRLDADNPKRPGLLVLTGARPSWEHLTEQAGWPSADDLADPQVVVRDYQPLLDRLGVGQAYAFRLVANPAQSTRRPLDLTARQRERSVDGKLERSVRLGHRGIAHQVEWLTSRAERWGFVVPQARSSGDVGQPVADLRVIARQRLSFGKGRAPGRVVVQSVGYEGRLEVLDPGRLRTAMVEGMGPAKAYGCGLLTLARLPDGASGVVAG